MIVTKTKKSLGRMRSKFATHLIGLVFKEVTSLKGHQDHMQFNTNTFDIKACVISILLYSL